MYGDFALIETNGALERATRVFIDGQSDKDESWLRDLLFEHSGILPVQDIDSAFASLIPLCTELRTEAGPIDATFINEQGRLTIVECKLWKNPQARREVVAQILDYVSALSEWTYADLQRQVAAATGIQGRSPYEIAKSRAITLPREPVFIDGVSRSLREGRILALIVGDGIREDVRRLTDTVNRGGAGKAFSLGLVEMGIYETAKRQMIIQPRVLGRTEVITRELTLISGLSGDVVRAQYATEEEAPTDSPQTSPGKQHLKEWWKSVLEMTFDDPEQEPPYWVGTNNVILRTPFRGVEIKGAALVNSPTVMVFLSGRKSEVAAVSDFIRSDRRALLRELPPGTEIDSNHRWPIITLETELAGDDDRRAWLKATLNQYVNVLRPRLRKWYSETARQ